MKNAVLILGAGSLVWAHAVQAQPAPAPARSVNASAGRLPEGAVKLQPAKPGVSSGNARSATVKVPIAVEGVATDRMADALRVTSGPGKITRSATGESILEVPSTGRVVVSSEGAKAAAAGSRISEAEKTPLPWLVVEASQTASGTAVRVARPFLKLARAILWNASAQRHEAEFLFGLDAESGDPGPLESAVVARFAVSCDQVAPAEASVSRVGPAGYGTLHVGCSPSVKNEREEQLLEILLDQGNLSYPFTIPHRPGPPVLETDHTTPGLGFGAPMVTVSSVEEDGTPLIAADALPVSFKISEGNLSLDPVVIAKGAQRVSVRVHPSGLHPVKVRAVLREQPSEEETINLTAPVAPIVSVLFGGSLGGALVLARTSWKDKRKALMRIAGGAGTGLLLGLLALLLPSMTGLPDWAPRTELGLFLVAAFAGVLGTRLLRWAAGLVFPGFRDDGGKKSGPASGPTQPAAGKT